MSKDEFPGLDRGIESVLRDNLGSKPIPAAPNWAAAEKQGAPRAPEGPIDSAHSTLELARRVATRVATLRDRLVGPSPESTGKVGADTGGGVLGALREHAVDVADELSAAEAALAQIERALP